MPQRGEGPDFIEALARGLEVLRAFYVDCPRPSLSQVAAASDLTRPTARRFLLTLRELGYVRSAGGRFELTPRVLDLGMAVIGSQSLWDLAGPHLEALVARTGESTSMTELDVSDILYPARVAVPKIIALRVEVGTRFPAAVTAQGKVLLAAMPLERAAEVLAIPSRSGVRPWAEPPPPEQLHAMLCRVHAQGWATADNELAAGVRSIAVPVRDGQGAVRAAMNVSVNAAETNIHTLTELYLPYLREAAMAIEEDWARWQSRPQSEMPRRTKE
jgi:IclR family pca regulon transcriptional regulator